MSTKSKKSKKSVDESDASASDVSSSDASSSNVKAKSKHKSKSKSSSKSKTKTKKSKRTPREVAPVSKEAVAKVMKLVLKLVVSKPDHYTKTSIKKKFGEEYGIAVVRKAVKKLRVEKKVVRRGTLLTPAA